MATVNTNRFKTDKNGRKYIIVISGDTLSEIAKAHFGSSYKAPDSYNELAKLNGIENPNKIIVGQTIYLTAASTSTPSKQPVNTRGVTITQFGLLADGKTNELYATWTWHREGDTSEYDIEWKWYRAGVWKYQDETNIRRYSTFTIPDDGITSKIQFRVRPVPKTDTKNNVEVKRFEDNLWSDWNECTYYVVNKPDVPGVVDVALEDLELTATISNPGTSKASIIKFQLIEDGNLSTASIGRAAVDDDLTTVSHVFTVLAGHTYTVRACANKDNNDSEWTSESASVSTKPVKVALSDPVVKEVDDTEKTATVYLEWSKSATAESYTLEYVVGEFVENSDVKPTEEPNISKDATNFTISKLNLKNGTNYSFRVKAVKGTESSEWSDVKTVNIGTAPTAPTTWSSTTTAMNEKGETVALYWVHNSTDGSTQTSATVKLTIEGVDNLNTVSGRIQPELGTLTKTEVDDAKNTITYTITAGKIDGETNPTHSLLIEADAYPNGAKITWNVVTVSSANKASAASADRVVEIFSRPGVSVEVSNTENTDIGTTYFKVEYVPENGDIPARYERTEETLSPLDGDPVDETFTVTNNQVRSAEVDGETVYYCVVEDQDSSLKSFPFNVKVTVSEEEIQRPVEYQLVLVANDHYTTVDNLGNSVQISAGESVYSKHYSASGYTPLEATISASDVSLENGQSYTLKCVVAMSSGIMVEAFTELNVSWSATNYYLDAEILLDRTNCSVSLRPYCSTVDDQYVKVIYGYYSYKIATDANDNFITYEYAIPKYKEPDNIEPIVVGYISHEQQDYPVYAGTLLDGTDVYYILMNNYVAVSNVLLSVYRREYDGTFTEIIKNLDASKNAFVPDPHPSLDYARYRIIATDKTTSAVTYRDIANYPIGEKSIIIQWNEPYSAYAVTEDGLSSGNGTETLIRLPYNIDVTNSKDREVSLIKYIGRKHPVSYYGTQVGETATYRTVIPKSDTEMIYALQRLQAYAGNVYVREPYGSGYWATVRVSFTKAYLAVAIPITIDVTRVEGGA